MMVRSSARVDGFYGAVSIQWAMRRQHKVPVLSEAVLMKNAGGYLPGGLPISSWRWLVIRRQALLSSSTNNQRALLTMA